MVWIRQNSAQQHHLLSDLQKILIIKGEKKQKIQKIIIKIKVY